MPLVRPGQKAGIAPAGVAGSTIENAASGQLIRAVKISLHMTFFILPLLFFGLFTLCDYLTPALSWSWMTGNSSSNKHRTEGSLSPPGPASSYYFQNIFY